MKIWSRRKLSTKRAAEAKAFLMRELSPHTWKREATPEEEARAVSTLKRILHYLRETPPGPLPVSVPILRRCHMDYLLPLMATEEKLRRGEYRNACNELKDLVYFYPVLSPGIRRNVIKLLEEYVGTDSEEATPVDRTQQERAQLECEGALQQIDVFLSKAEDSRERTAILDYAIKAVGRDLIGEGLIDCELNDFRFALLCDLAAMKQEREKR